jgi:hypothetical protein
MKSAGSILSINILCVVFTVLFLTGCTTFKNEIPDFKAHITLPASGDGYWVKTVSPDEGRIPKEEWAIKSRRGIIILSEDWAILRFTLLKNCLNNTSCETVIGTFDNLFKTIDDALKKMPKPKP